MHLQQLRDALHRDLSRPCTAQRLHRVMELEPVLQALGTSEAILTLLHDRCRTAGERNTVLAALVRAAQQSRAPELSTLLIVAFHPGLAKLCARLRAVAPRERDGSLVMLVLESFIETVHSFRVETQAGSATLGLLFGTRRAALALLHRRKKEGDCDPEPIDAEHEVAASTANPEVALVCREVAREVTRVLTHPLRTAGILDGSADWSERSDAMLRARSAPCADRTHEERREYRRAQRARHRALSGRMDTIRNRLSSIREHLPLLQQEGWQ